MTQARETHFLNADFDVSLRPRSGRSSSRALARQSRELTVHALLGVDDGDAVLTRAGVPDDFLAHLELAGLAVPELLEHPRIDPHTRLRPFGWNREAIELNRRHHEPVEHPPLETVRRVNSRRFALELEARLFPGGTSGEVVDSVSELEALLARSESGSEWVVKSEHGNSALANRRVKSPALSSSDRGFVEDRLAEDDHCVVEPWRTRDRDWCVIFDVPLDRSRLRVHETIGTADGALIGALFEPEPIRDSPWAGELEATAEKIAAVLGEEGYFGPVCLDAFSWHDDDRCRLRPLVDLNCRRSMSEGAYRAWRRIAPERVFYYRFFVSRKLSLPVELAAARSSLGKNVFNPARARGALFASPLRVVLDGAERRAGKFAVVFVGEDRSDVFAQEAWFRERFER